MVCVCAPGLQNTPAKVRQLVKAAPCQVTRHHAASDRNGPVTSEAMNRGPQPRPSISPNYSLLLSLSVNVATRKHLP